MNETISSSRQNHIWITTFKLLREASSLIAISPTFTLQCLLLLGVGSTVKWMLNKLSHRKRWWNVWLIFYSFWLRNCVAKQNSFHAEFKVFQIYWMHQKRSFRSLISKYELSFSNFKPKKLGLFKVFANTSYDLNVSKCFRYVRNRLPCV